MEHNFMNQLIIFGYSCILGAVLGVLYDLFRIIRMIINTRNIAMFVQDVIYFVVSGLITFAFVLAFNRGESRFYILAGEGIGWIAYHLTLGEFAYRRSSRHVKYLKLKLGVLKSYLKGMIMGKNNKSSD